MKKMIIFVLLLLISIMFVGCTKNNGDINSVDNEILECSSIKIVVGDNAWVQESYSAATVTVFEYKNESGDAIYLSSDQYKTIKFYKAKEHQFPSCEYNYERNVGRIICKQFIYLDISNKKVDVMVKYFKESSGNNSEAYNCARKNFYIPNGNIIYKEDAIKDLEKHTYVKYESGYVIYELMDND